MKFSSFLGLTLLSSACLAGGAQAATFACSGFTDKPQPEGIAKLGLLKEVQVKDDGQPVSVKDDDGQEWTYVAFKNQSVVYKIDSVRIMLYSTREAVLNRLIVAGESSPESTLISGGSRNVGELTLQASFECKKIED
jgi:hypothetical protein